MKKLSYLIIFFLAFTFFSCKCNKDEPVSPEDTQYVYVCTSNSAKTYHTFRDCSGLKNCNGEILEVTRKKARENERIICSICSKREKNSEKDSTK